MEKTVRILLGLWIFILSADFSVSIRKPPAWGRYGKYPKRHPSQGNSQGNSDDSAEDISCEYPWQQLHRSCVQFIKVKSEGKYPTWSEARDKCLALNADLLCINDIREKQKAHPLLKQHVRSLDTLTWWVGLRQIDANGTWYWVDNDMLNTNLVEWAPGEGHLIDDNGVLLTDQCAVFDYQGYLQDVSCNETHPFICEQVKLTPPPTSTTTSATITTLSPTTPNITTETTTSTTQSTTESTTEKDKTKKPKTTTSTPTTDSTRTTTTEQPKTKKTPKPKDEAEIFQGCYAVNYESTCPPVEAFGIQWPRTLAGEMAFVPCDRNKHAKWKCDKNPTCWRAEPDVKQCTSENIQELNNQLENLLNDLENAEQAESFTENLASTAVADSVMSEQDIYQSTKLMEAASQAIPKNSSVAKNIIKNVVKCGSGLVSKTRQKTWASMSKENQRTVAASLLSSMETVTSKMLKSFDKPTVEKIEEDNMAIELQVVDTTDRSHTTKVTFDTGTTNFAIPRENLRSNNRDNLARLVFINYDSVGMLMDPELDDDDDDDVVVTDDNDNGVTTKLKLVSKVVSASMGEEKIENIPLKKPITFTMFTGDLTPKNQQLCSFWNFSLKYTGAWSQRGCSFKSYNETHTTCQCNHLTNFAILMNVHSTKLDPIHATTLSYVTYVGIIISIVCLFLSWITFICLSIRCMRGSRGSSAFGDAQEYYGNSGSSSSSAGARTAQGERNSIHKNLVFCLFVAEVLFLAGIERTDHQIACSIIAGFLHYFFLASFMWMFVEGIHILFMLVQVFDAAKSRLRYYYCIGYGAPLFVVGVSALVYHEGYGTQRYCWLTTERMFIWSFAGPVALILLVNLVILIYAMSAVCKHSEYVFTKEKSTAWSMKAWIQGALAIEVLLGLTWVFGYFYISAEAIPIAYLFTIFNSLQGLFIFVFHCVLNKKVRKEYQRFIDYPKRPVTSSTNMSKGSHQNGSGPQTASLNMSSRKQSGPFLDLNKERRESAKSVKSTTSA
ncbi:hypothetical protein ACF0H5_004714 [Mactra antiquata]